MKLFKVIKPTLSSSKYPIFMYHLWCHKEVLITQKFIEEIKSNLTANKGDNLRILPLWFPLIEFGNGEDPEQIENAEDPFETLTSHIGETVKMKCILGSIDPINDDDPVIFNRKVKVPNGKRNPYQSLSNHRPLDDTIYGMDPNIKGYQYENSNIKELKEENQPLNVDSKFLNNLTRMEDNNEFPHVNYTSGNILQMYFSCFDKSNPSSIDIQKLFDAFDELLDDKLVFVKIWSDNSKKIVHKISGNHEFSVVSNEDLEKTWLKLTTEQREEGRENQNKGITFYYFSHIEKTTNEKKYYQVNIYANGNIIVRFSFADIMQIQKKDMETKLKDLRELLLNIVRQISFAITSNASLQHHITIPNQFSYEDIRSNLNILQAHYTLHVIKPPLFEIEKFRQYVEEEYPQFFSLSHVKSEVESSVYFKYIKTNDFISKDWSSTENVEKLAKILLLPKNSSIIKKEDSKRRQKIRFKKQIKWFH